MRKKGIKGSKLFIGLVITLILFFAGGCALTKFGQVEPKYKTVQFAYSINEFYPLTIPGFMPDFTEFDSRLVMYNSFLILLNYFVPESEMDKDGIKDHYRFFINADPDDVPGIIALSSFIGEESRFWAYDKEGLPQEMGFDQFTVWLQEWMNAQASKMYKEENPAQSI